MKVTKFGRLASLLAATALVATPLAAQNSAPKDATPKDAAIAAQSSGDIPAKYTPPTAAYDYIKREVMIPMRDGVKLHTVIVIPKGATNAPILLTRTPYDASIAREPDG